LIVSTLANRTREWATQLFRSSKLKQKARLSHPARSYYLRVDSEHVLSPLSQEFGSLGTLPIHPTIATKITKAVIQKRGLTIVE